jgi:hypothetical protein
MIKMLNLYTKGANRLNIAQADILAFVLALK